MQLELQGIGTHWHIEIQDELTIDQQHVITEGIKNIISTFENNYSRFKESSWIGKLNNLHYIKDFPQELYEMLSFFTKIESISEDSFTPKIGTILARNGYDKNYSFTTKDTHLKDGLSLKFTNEEIITSIATQIDLGGIGKGWLIDKIKVYLLLHNMRFFLINGGGDIYATEQKDNTPFRILLESPFSHNEHIGYIDIMNAAVACSSPNKRTWKDKLTKETRHHLVNFHSQKEVSKVSSVFTYGQDALSADTASTAIFVSSPHLYQKIADALKVTFLVISPEGQMYTSGYPGVLNV